MTRTLRVLVVDDDVAVANGTVRLLEHAGYSVERAFSGEAGWQAAWNGHPDLVLLDRDMPGIDGLEVCRRIKADPALADTLVVMASAFSVGTEDQAEGLEGGADGYIVRPIANRELLARVAAFGRIRELARTLRLQAAALQAAGESATRAQAATLDLLEDALEARRAADAAQEEIRALNETLEARVLERTAELQAANDELETFSYSVSHDLRAPLRAISGFAELLARRYGDKLDERGRTYVDTIVTSVDHMATLIDELLEYARLGRSVVRSEPVPLGPLVGGLRATFAGRIGATGATFMVAEPLATPVADPVLLERILANLIDNALTYRRPDVAPELILSATAHGRRVTISLTDNGIGIPVEFQERIFAVFTRLHDGDVYEGTGIGLAIVRKAARLMDSDVTVASTLGEGSTFSLDLPAVRMEAPAKPHEEGTET